MYRFIVLAIVAILAIIAICLSTSLQPLTVYIDSFALVSNNLSGKNDNNNNNINYPTISPNPVSELGQIKISSNATDNTGIAKLITDIVGPNLGLSNQNFTLPKVGSVPLSLVAGDPKNGTWMGTFTFPEDSPDGTYIYNLISTDSLGNIKTSGPFSGIILDRYPAQDQGSQARIISAIDGDKRNIPNNGSTSSKDMAFMFDGRDRTGVVLFMQCNLDDKPVQSEHGEEHAADATTPKTTYSTCFVADKIADLVKGNHSYSDLAVGNHTFKVRVIDNEYNIGAIPAVFNWTILPAQ